MNWKRRNDYAIRSDCGRFAICKVMVKGQWWYEARSVSSGQLITRTLDPAEAKAACNGGCI